MLTRNGKRVHDYIEGSSSDDVGNLPSELSVYAITFSMISSNFGLKSASK